MWGRDPFEKGSIPHKASPSHQNIPIPHKAFQKYPALMFHGKNIAEHHVVFLVAHLKDDLGVHKIEPP